MPPCGGSAKEVMAVTGAALMLAMLEPVRNMRSVLPSGWTQKRPRSVLAVTPLPVKVAVPPGLPGTAGQFCVRASAGAVGKRAREGVARPPSARERAKRQAP